MKASGYKYLEQTADARIFVWAGDFKSLLEESVQGLVNLMIDTNQIESMIEADIEIEGKNDEEILFNLLSEILYIIDCKNFILKEIRKIEMINDKVFLKLAGDNTNNYVFHGEVKAITYHDFFVKKDKEGNYIAQVVVDL